MPEEEDAVEYERDKRIRLQSTMRTFDEIAEDFDRTRYKPWPQCVEFGRTIPEDSLVLDLGCGNGRNTTFLAEKQRVIGLDISHKMVDIARRNLVGKGLGDKCEFIQCDVTDIPLRDSTFDSVLYIATLHHIPTEAQRLKSLEELRRVMKEGSRALISVWAFDQPRFQKLLEEHLKKGENFGDIHVEWKRPDGTVFNRFYHLFYRDELKKLAEGAELKVDKYFKASDNYFAIVERNSKD
jgi:ubiquinone/menaquinone biosynthesis C-methylase UbiE